MGIESHYQALVLRTCVKIWQVLRLRETGVGYGEDGSWVRLAMTEVPS